MSTYFETLVSSASQCCNNSSLMQLGDRCKSRCCTISGKRLVGCGAGTRCRICVSMGGRRAGAPTSWHATCWRLQTSWCTTINTCLTLRCPLFPWTSSVCKVIHVVRVGYSKQFFIAERDPMFGAAGVKHGVSRAGEGMCCGL